MHCRFKHIYKGNDEGEENDLPLIFSALYQS